MKKILAIVTMAAMVAGAFAADMSAKAKNTGDILTVNGGAFTLLPAPTKDAGELKTAYSDDFCGAEYNGSGSWIWFKPIDLLKVKIGGGDYKVLTDDTKVAGNGYAFEVSTNGIEFDLALGAPFVAGSTIGEVAVKAAYTADFGTIAATFAKDAKLVGFGYNGATAPLSYQAEVAFNFGTNVLDVEAKFGYADAISASVEADAKMALKPSFALSKLGVNAEFGGAAGAINWYFKVNTGIKPSFGITVNPGVKGSLGAMAWDVGAKVVYDTAVKFSVPFEVSIAW